MEREVRKRGVVVAWAVDAFVLMLGGWAEDAEVVVVVVGGGGAWARTPGVSVRGGCSMMGCRVLTMGGLRPGRRVGGGGGGSGRK